MTPLVSVVLPAFNATACVERAVRSTLVQTFGDWELVVVDDGSSDDTGASALKAAGGDPRVRALRIEHGGIVRALEAGLAAACGKYIARMDADDEMMPRRLGAQVEFLESRRDVGVVGSLVEFGGDLVAARGYALHVEWLNSLVEPEAIALNRFIESPLAHPSVLFRRELPEVHGGYRETGWLEDYELWLRWMDAGVRMAKVPEVLLRWNDPPRRLSRVDPRYGEDRLYACKCHWLARWLRGHLAATPGRRVLLWGAGRVTRKRFAALATHGIALGGFIDIDAKKIGRRIGALSVLSPDELPESDEAFVIGGVGTRGARGLIRESLCARSYIEGRDFVMAA